MEPGNIIDMNFTDAAAGWLSNPNVQRIIIAVAGVIVIVLLIRLLRALVRRRIKDTERRYRLRKIVSFIGYLIGIFFVVTVFGQRLGGIQVAFGIAGAGIAFSLQEVIVSIAGWIAISFGNFYRPGERVLLGGIMGDVIDIGMLRTTLMECGQWVNADQYNGRIVRIANSFVFKEPVFNYSSDFPFLWDEINMPVKYGSDYALARKIFIDVLQEVTGDYSRYAEDAWKVIVRKYLIEAASVEPMVVMKLTDNWVQFTLRYVVDYKARRNTSDRMFSRILEEIDKTEGRVSIASATIQITEGPPIDIRMSDIHK
ncbi:MAG: mechanosensitive ion channel family protein [Nitrospirota bacterium]